jgi:hypothetical protein
MSRLDLIACCSIGNIIAISDVAGGAAWTIPAAVAAAETEVANVDVTPLVK